MPGRFTELLADDGARPAHRAAGRQVVSHHAHRPDLDLRVVLLGHPAILHRKEAAGTPGRFRLAGALLALLLHRVLLAAGMNLIEVSQRLIEPLPTVVRYAVVLFAGAAFLVGLLFLLGEVMIHGYGTWTAAH